jgi:Carboxylesterase family
MQVICPHRQRGCGYGQLPPGRIRISRSPGTHRRCSGSDLRKLWNPGSATRASVGTTEYSCIRWNPDNVTIFGQSAGGLSVLANMTSPSAHGLFHKAIVQSGTYELVLPSLAAGEAQGTEFASNVECSDQTAQCLRSLTVQKILSDQTSVGPVVDGVLLPLPLQTAAASGQFSHVPVINGSNHDEARFMYAMNELAGQVVTSSEYPTAVITGFGPSWPSNSRAVSAYRLH